MNFYEIPNGLYCHDTDTNVTQPKTLVSVYSFVNTVECNLTFYTRCEKMMENKTRVFYRKSTFPSPQHFINLLDIKYYRNYPVTSTDDKQAIHIRGKYIFCIADEKTREFPNHLLGLPPTPLPITIRDAALCIVF